jgi:hypothetical protein
MLRPTMNYIRSFTRGVTPRDNSPLGSLLACISFVMVMVIRPPRASNLDNTHPESTLDMQQLGAYSSCQFRQAEERPSIWATSEGASTRRLPQI